MSKNLIPHHDQNGGEGFTNILADSLQQYDESTQGKLDRMARGKPFWEVVGAVGRRMWDFVTHQKYYDNQEQLKSAHDGYIRVFSDGLNETNPLEADKKFAKAQKYIDKAIALNPQGELLHYDRALLFYARGMLPEAIKSLRQEVANHPENYFAFSHEINHLTSLAQKKLAEEMPQPTSEYETSPDYVSSFVTGSFIAGSIFGGALLCLCECAKNNRQKLQETTDFLMNKRVCKEFIGERENMKILAKVELPKMKEIFETIWEKSMEKTEMNYLDFVNKKSDLNLSKQEKKTFAAMLRGLGNICDTIAQASNEEGFSDAVKNESRRVHKNGIVSSIESVHGLACIDYRENVPGITNRGATQLQKEVKQQGKY